MSPPDAAAAGVWGPAGVAAAFDFCLGLAARHYENFPVASLLLPDRTRRHVAAVYAFARIADDFADEPEYEGERRERLEDWRAQLKALEDGRGARAPGHPVFLALGETLREFGLPKEPFELMLGAFLQDVDKSRYATFDELADYCRRCAAPLGRVVLMIHGVKDEPLLRAAEPLCVALQLTNFWQDLGGGLRRDRIYIPAEDFRQFGYSEADLRMGVVNERFRGLMRHEWKRTRGLFEEGRPLWRRLKGPLSWEVKLAWMGGVEILRKVQKLGFDTLSRRPALSALDWAGLVMKSLTFR